ncbi:ABC transporter permease [Nonomuraea sp. KC401]|uniref:ABC transporter permease n=1 Tax=Nonomuraea longispora TaxID=1848320 RepID=A0A4R4NP05_9ACTN|nr:MULTISPECIES: ABC transporter permease [Nonomuraea]NBE94838.1 ABC transporter permease subunit [Nonomuraea sp. K271]TDC09447.1 ABC transporter permease [Nonomuraea longispora]TLF75081.1 ABC transporter permease [Nonomuraea sp. KC401]
MSNPTPPVGTGLPDTQTLVTEPTQAPERGGKKAKDGKPASLWTDAWYDLRRRPMFIISVIIIFVLLVMSFWPSLFTSIDPFNARSCDLSTARQGPSPGHLFGRDNLGCDLYSRTIYGARNSIIIGVFTTIVTTLVGSLLGIVAGYRGGAVDAVSSRFTEIFFAIPAILGALLIAATFRGKANSILLVIVALGVLGWPMTYRIMRAAVITAKSQDFVVAARALGAGAGRIMFRHLLPNSLAPVIVVATINLGGFIAAEAALSFLGVGVLSPDISWGLMIADARNRFLEAPLPLVFPAAFLCVTVLAFIMMGDAVRDALDPKLR